MRRAQTHALFVIGAIVAVQAAPSTAPPLATMATASFASGASSFVTGDAVGTYIGTIDSKNGNFSFNLVGSSRRVCFNFEAPLALLTSPRIPGATPPASGCYAVSFTTVASASGTGLLSISPGQTELRDVRFNWNNPSAVGPNDPTNYHLGFRGDADLDGLVEMSRVKVTCEAGDGANACTRWTLEPCAGSDPVCLNAVAVDGDGNALGTPAGQVGGASRRGAAPPTSRVTSSRGGCPSSATDGACSRQLTVSRETGTFRFLWRPPLGG